MQISIQYVKMSHSETLTNYTLDKLEKLSKKYDWLIKANVFFKLKTEASTKKSVCEIELSLPGPRIFASSEENNFEMAVKETISDLNKQLKKRKATFNKHTSN